MVARHHSFVRAATELHLTPSAVSLQIKELEQAVGLPLFGRSGKTSALTPAGQVLLTDVNRALLALRDAEEALSRLRGRETGIVSVGVVSNAKYFVPRILARFHEDHPDVELRVSLGNREQLLRQLANGEVDFAIMGQPPLEHNLRAEALGPQPLGILAAPEHPLAGDREIPVGALAQCKFIVREPGSGTRAAMERFFHDALIKPTRVMELTCNDSIKQAVIANMGIAFLSLHTAGLELQGNVLVVLDIVGLPLMRRWHVVQLESAPLSESAESLRRFIVDFGTGFIARHFDGLIRRPDISQAAVANSA